MQEGLIQTCLLSLETKKLTSFLSILTKKVIDLAFGTSSLFSFMSCDTESLQLYYCLGAITLWRTNIACDRASERLMLTESVVTLMDLLMTKVMESEMKVDTSWDAEVFSSATCIVHTRMSVLT